MKTLIMTLTAALTFMATQAQAELVKLPCGKIHNNQNVRRDNTSTIYKPGALARNSGTSNSTPVQSDN